MSLRRVRNSGQPGGPLNELLNHERISSMQHWLFAQYLQSRWFSLLNRVQELDPSPCALAALKALANQQLSFELLGQLWNVNRGSAFRRVERYLDRLARRLVEGLVDPVLDSLLTPGGGATLDAFTQTHVPPLPLWAVGLQRHACRWPRRPGHDEVAAFLWQRAAELFANSEPRFLGTWRDPDSDTYWLDLTVLIPDRDEAVARGLRESQRAITNLATLETISLREARWRNALRGE